MDARRRAGPQDLLEAKENLALMVLAMSGQFDPQIAAMKVAKEELEASQAVHRTLAEAEQIKHAAVQFATTARLEVEGIEARAEEHRLEIFSSITKARAVLDRATKEKDITHSGWIELERDKELFVRQRSEAEVALARREEMVAEREAKIAEEYAKVQLQQAKLATRLRKLEEV